MPNIPLITFCFLLISIPLVLSVPTWESFNNRQALGTLVPGATFLEALGPVRRAQPSDQPNYISVHGQRGSPGRAIVTQESSPPLFYINHDQLWQYQNDTYIFPVSVLNSTLTADAPLQVTISEKSEGLSGGRWRWRGTMLYYDLGSKTNQGLFYTCQDKSGAHGVFMFLDPSPTPKGCEIVTIHSFVRRSPSQ
ncbi:hypothetical protein BJ138DRAFT_1144109 [Hygrophoropsis aurantiaca]|uniref:Uncharacterized protein n=1 Tax=Hygrophoropsis aurantiaca TaxID=72124 RepID=A0ACB8AME6_9AGAM|nr:hypothetical protein BJ138DRAFT_1144109 [Hygrophoropsis aurantiaca]